jgi:DNA invertase Pin-like site-specific DNA recombinase
MVASSSVPTLQRSPKVTARHLQRRAYVYVRQSSQKQLYRHKESREYQYALSERAVALGWPEKLVRVIDSDMGLSGQSSGGREGFRELVSEVSLGHVGLVLCYEASRLARNNSDWYALLDLCALRGTLIADTDGVYDPTDYNDRMLLGLRGMMSEAELHLLRGRLDAGRIRQVERGTYRQILPTGLLRLEGGRVVKDPDARVQQAISLIFERFEKLGSAQKVLRSLRDDDGILLPRRQSGGPYAGQLLWKKPTDSAIYEILRNPAYAGAFVYGRHGAAPDREPGSARRVHKPMEEWIAIHKDVYPAYISWEEFVTIHERLDANGYGFVGGKPGASRNGRALLTGLAVCGRCARKMRVHYESERPRYICTAMVGTHAGSTCLHLQGRVVEEAVVRAFFEAVRPSELALLDEVLAAKSADRERLLKHHKDRVKGAAYEVGLAEKRYRSVDPENRLVASELERGWEEALQALSEAEEAAQRFERERPESTLDPTLQEQLSDLGARLPELWESGRLRAEHKKDLLRSLIRCVVLSRPAPDTIEVRIVWVSGAVSPIMVRPKISRAKDLSEYTVLVEKILALAQEGYTDKAIAGILSEEGFRSARDTRKVPASFVGKVRRAHGQRSLTHHFRSKEKLSGRWTVLGLSRELGVDRNWFYKRIESGAIPAERNPKTGHYLIANDPALIARLRAQVSEGQQKHRN